MKETNGFRYIQILTVVLSAALLWGVMAEQCNGVITEIPEVQASEILTAGGGKGPLKVRKEASPGLGQSSRAAAHDIPTSPPDEAQSERSAIAVMRTGTAGTQSPVTEIPEKSWPDSHRVRFELTEEIAKKYPGGKFVSRTVPNLAWGPGEELVFSIDYSIYRAGTATMSVKGVEEVNGGRCYHIQTTARSNEFISKIYKVRDMVNSYIDIEGLFSRRFEKELREGGYTSDRYVDFYHDRLIALNTKKKHALTEITPYIQDVLSALYNLRTCNLEVGKDEIIDVYADGKVYPLRVVVHKKERVTVPAGRFECLLIEPKLQSEGIFRQKGKLLIWLTDDSRKIPVKMTSRIVIGSIGSNLESYTLGEIR